MAEDVADLIWARIVSVSDEPLDRLFASLCIHSSNSSGASAVGLSNGEK